jgi:hypothetical protein
LRGAAEAALLAALKMLNALEGGGLPQFGVKAGISKEALQAYWRQPLPDF